MDSPNERDALIPMIPLAVFGNVGSQV